MSIVGEALVSLGVQSLNVVVRAELVREVMGGGRWIAVPGARDEAPGVVVWSGRAVTVVDLARFSPGCQRLEVGEQRGRIVIVEAFASSLALPVDRVSEVWRADTNSIREKEISDFELARLEVVQQDMALPLFEPELFLGKLGIET